MSNKLVVVADLGRLKAFRLRERGLSSKPQLQLIEDRETNITNHLREEVTDQAGRYRKGTGPAEGPSALSDGEQHNLDLERRRRALKSIAQQIGELVEREGVEGFYLAADERINPQILNELDRGCRDRLEKNVTANLSKLSPSELIQHFAE